MSTARAIRYKIASIKNTQKITKAMQMVAASKMRKAQDRMLATRPYAAKIVDVIAHLANAHPEYRHPYMQVRDIQRVGFIVISTDRGLCGALNANLLRETLKELQKWKAEKVEQELCVVGGKADIYFRRFDVNVVAKASHIGDEEGLKDLIGAVKVMLDAYGEEKIDALFLAKNNFINTLTQRSSIQQLLPIASTQTDYKQRYWDYIYEPDAKELLNGLLGRYIESQVYQAVVENNACEQAARMISMKNATDNAGQVINELMLDYNKVRQAAITREIAEIVSGAAAIGN